VKAGQADQSGHEETSRTWTESEHEAYAQGGVPERDRELHVGDPLHLVKARGAGQAQHQGVELLAAQHHGLQRAGCRPLEAPLVQASRGAPDTEAVVHQQLHARARALANE